MKKYNALQFTFITACGIAVSYYLYNLFFKKQVPEEVKTDAGVVIGTINNSVIETNPVTNTLTSLTPAEKEELFYQSRGYVGGAAPSSEILEHTRITQQAAIDKIRLYKLEDELQEYLKQFNNGPFPA